MGFLSNLFSSDTAKFLAGHALVSFISASGHSVRLEPAKTRDLQCVKLTTEHKSVVQMISFWCSIRTNKLQMTGASPEAVAKISKADARFLTTLSGAIDVANDKEEPDAWLFFDGDVKDTDFFELQFCDRGTKLGKASFVIRADR
jgi:hypothetical protein